MFLYAVKINQRFTEFTQPFAPSILTNTKSKTRLAAKYLLNKGFGDINAKKNTRKTIEKRLKNPGLP